MDENFCNTCFTRRVRKRDHVRIMAVHTAVGNQPEQMKSMTPRSCKGFLQYLITCQFTFLDRFVNSRQVLINDSTRSQVQVANFRVAHLSFRQTDVDATRA